MIVVYGPSASPYVRKVLAFASEKQLPIERGGANPGSAPDPDFLKASPFRKIPAMKDGDFMLADSSAIVAYMDKVGPAPELIPSEAKSHARTIWFDEFADTILGHATVAMFFNRIVAPMLGRPADLSAADKAEAEALPPAFDYLESAIPTSGFLVDDRLTLADLSVTTFFVNLGHMNIRPSATTHPKLAAYVSKIMARPSFAAIIAEEQKMFAPQPA